jgi:hypothetical protein
MKNCNLLLPRTSTLQENPSALKRELLALQKIKLISFFRFSFFPGYLSATLLKVVVVDPIVGCNEELTNGCPRQPFIKKPYPYKMERW